MHKAADITGFDVQAMTPGTSQAVSTSGTSAQSSALATTTRVVRLCATSDTYVAFGSNPTATSSSMLLPAYSREYFTLPGGATAWKIAGLQVSGAGSLSIVEMY